MVIARFEFKPEIASYFCEDEQTVVEMPFESVQELVAYCKTIEQALVDCTVYDGQAIYNLKAHSH